jgi:serine O-acetyltransferase
VRISLSPDKLEEYIVALLCQHFPDGYKPDIPLRKIVAIALDRAEHCFGQIHRKYYREGNVVLFDHLNGDHFASFLYFLANSAWLKNGNTELATRLFYLNKVMHGLDLFYSITMPEVFMLVHPVGSVLGNANYGNNLVVYQNVTVGADEAGIYPTFGDGTVLYSKSSVIGECLLGDDVVVSANAFILNTNVPSCSLVVGQYPGHIIKKTTVSVTSRIFRKTDTRSL